MKKYYRHTLLYLHETISLGSARSDRFTEIFTDTYQPMMDELGARLFAIWESTPYNGHWPQVTGPARRAAAVMRPRRANGRRFWPTSAPRARGESCTRDPATKR
jgi:hypothetical protein